MSELNQLQKLKKQLKSINTQQKELETKIKDLETKQKLDKKIKELEKKIKEQDKKIKKLELENKKLSKTTTLYYETVTTNEHFKNFVNQKIEEDKNENYLSIEKIYIAYKQWYQDNYADNNMKKRKDLQRYLDDKYNKNWKPSDSKNIGYSGIKLILHDNFETSSCEIVDELDN